MKSKPRTRASILAREFFPKEHEAVQRYCYRQGYHQAEKDFALTLEDVVMIGNIILDLKAINFNDGYFTRPFYEEVLRRFNEQRKK